MPTLSGAQRIREAVSARYGAVAQQGGSCCGPNSACCGKDGELFLDQTALMGYSRADVQSVLSSGTLSLGCGNPGAIAALQPGEVVVDLGSGAGFDCFLSSPMVGETGRVIGVDMTPAMLSRARAQAAELGYTNVEFRLGEIEHLPVADNSVNVIISNCVVNLAPDKLAVFREAYRVLAPGGRLAIADTVATAALPEDVRQDMALWSECVSGSLFVDDLIALLRQAGFEQVRVEPKDESRALIDSWVPGRALGDYVLSAYIQAIKPAAAG